MKRIIILCLSIISLYPLMSQELIELESGIKISNSISATTDPGTIRWTGSDFEGYDGSKWLSLTSANNSVVSYFITLPNGIQTLLNAGESITTILAAGAETAEFLGLKYMGGYIFKLEANGTGLMTTESDWPTRYYWGCYGQNVTGANGTAIGTGHQNTLDIVAECGDLPTTAAYLSFWLVMHGFDDWFLPSRDEFELMYSVLGGDNNIGGFNFGTYWTSSEYSGTHAWAISGNDGARGLLSKLSEKTIRPIRAF